MPKHAMGYFLPFAAGRKYLARTSAGNLGPGLKYNRLLNRGAGGGVGRDTCFLGPQSKR